MDSLIHKLENLSISDDWYLGKDLYNDKEFLEKSKKRIEEVITSSNCSFYVGKKLVALSVELVVTPTAEIANNLIKNVDEVVDEYFAETKILREIGWCANYTLDKRFRSVYLFI